MVHSALGTAHPSLLELWGLNGVGSRTLAWHNDRRRSRAGTVETAEKACTSRVMLSMLASALFKAACATSATQHDEQSQVSTSHDDGEHGTRAPRERQSKYRHGYFTHPPNTPPSIVLASFIGPS
ncbi:hypothetical protein N7G274_005072 [Stereocaulon virgatum]|uniref:Uncharacterized protein n=1 Tax=Stereocaulon virgatum TaxID=373712 RepID=A0ABR4A7V5_9LECA